MAVISSSGDGADQNAASLSRHEIQQLLDSAAEALARGDPQAARDAVVRVPLNDCVVGQLAKAARVAKRAGILDVWAAAGHRCVARFPGASDGYLVLLGDLDFLLKDPGLRAMALDLASRSLGTMESGVLRSAAVAFHVNRAIERLGADPALTARARSVTNAVFAADPDGAVWHARDLMRHGELEQAARVLDAHAAGLVGRPSEEAVLVRGRIALADGRWGRDWAHLKALDELKVPAADKARAEVDNVRSLFAELGESFDAGPTTPGFTAIASPESAARVICRRPRGSGPGPSAPPHGLMLAGGSLSAGGAERLMAICFRELRSRNVLGGVDLALAALGPGEDHNDPLFFLPLTGVSASDLVSLEIASVATRPFSYLRGGLARRAQSWYDLFSARRPRVVHSWLDYTHLTAGLAAVWAGVPKIILHSHNMRPESLFHESDTTGGQWREKGRGWQQTYAHLFARPEVHFVNVSRAATQDYLDWIEVDEDSVNAHTIYNGLDFAPFDEDGREAAAELRAHLGIPADAPVVGTALRFSSVKQPDHWVAAASQIRCAVPGVHFVMFGDGPDREPLMNKIEAGGASGYIHCPGRFSDIHLRLQLLDLFMMSSRSEGLPNALIESQACGIPVVAYDVGGVRETFVDGVTGRLVRPNDPTALAAVVVEVLSNPEWRRSAGEEGRRFARREFGIDAMVDNLEKLITH